ncbi:MAG TPA: heparan-alpha-glucosaminide N-acetyltransferase domain-containing protein [Gemmatimonadales bacterium]
MTTVLRPVPAPRPALESPAAPATPTAAPAVRRLDHVDMLRGLVMVIMVLDHVRAYLTEVRFEPTDLDRTNLALFATRWITHYCAPTFVALAGASAWIAGTRRTRPELARFLLSRGLWLILVELTLITFGWYFTTRITMGLVAQVIWVIGASMIVLAGLIYLPRAAIAAFGLALVLGHNLLDGVTPERFGALAPLWHVLHVPGRLEIVPVFLLYPLIPWAGVMALGYAAGPLVFSQQPGVARRLAWTGVLMTAAFVALRALDVYGDPVPRVADGGAALVGMSFLNLTKYPPSLLYLLMTLGPALVVLTLLRRVRGPLAGVLVTFGRVPFLFYVVHLYVVHAVAVAIGVIQGYAPGDMLHLFLELPDGYGVGLPVIYAAWLAVVAALYPLCHRYAALKARSRAWWLSYL